MTAFDYALEPNGVLNSVGGGGTPVVLTFGESQDHGVSSFVPTTQLTIGTAGIYLMELYVPWPYVSGGIRAAAIRVNSADYVCVERDPDNVNDTEAVVGIAALNAGDKLSTRVYQNSSTTLNFVGAYLRVALVHS